MKPENYSLGLIPIFSLFLSAPNKKVPAILYEESVKNGQSLSNSSRDENDQLNRYINENRNAETVKFDFVH